MPFLDTFERKFLFIVTRSFSLLLISCLLAVIIICGVLASRSLEMQTSKVTPFEVMQAIKPPVSPEIPIGKEAQTPDSEHDVLLGMNVKLPFVLQKHFSDPENIQILKGWLQQIPQNEQKGYLEELAAVVVEAEKIGDADVVKAVNKYRELKFTKILEQKQAKAELKAERLQYLGVSLACIALIALFSLTLVLLAIERNTREYKL